MIGVELRTQGRFSSNLEDGSAHLHTSRIVVKIIFCSAAHTFVCSLTGHTNNVLAKQFPSQNVIQYFAFSTLHLVPGEFPFLLELWFINLMIMHRPNCSESESLFIYSAIIFMFHVTDNL